MYLLVLILAYSRTRVYSRESENIFEMNADKLFKSVIGREPDHIHETTHNFHITDDYDDNATKAPAAKKITVPKVTADKERGKGILEPKTVEEARMRIKDLEIERILNEHINPIPNFEQGEDNPAIITRRFDKMVEVHNKYRRYRNEDDIKRRNVWRNRTLTMMQHFIYATRYKLPNSQVLRRKYHNSNRYRIGYCFGLLRHLKTQQLLMYMQLKTFQFRYSTLDTHMKLYEKVVRLDVDIKDIIRHIQELESNRRLKADPNYYDDYVEEKFPTPGPPGPKSGNKKSLDTDRSKSSGGSVDRDKAGQQDALDDQKIGNGPGSPGNADKANAENAGGNAGDVAGL